MLFSIKYYKQHSCVTVSMQYVSVIPLSIAYLFVGVNEMFHCIYNNKILFYILQNVSHVINICVSYIILSS